MYLDFRSPGRVNIKMDGYVFHLLEICFEEFSGDSKTPAISQRFQAEENAKKLDNKATAEFHYLVVKCPFLCQRDRRDIKLEVGFLYERVKAPDFEDNKKLRKLLRY